MELFACHQTPNAKIKNDRAEFTWANDLQSSLSVMRLLAPINAHFFTNEFCEGPDVLIGGCRIKRRKVVLPSCVADDGPRIATPHQQLPICALERRRFHDMLAS